MANECIVDDSTVGVALSGFIDNNKDFVLRNTEGNSLLVGGGYYNPGLEIGSPIHNRVDKSWIDSLMCEVKSKDIHLSFSKKPIKCEFVITDDASSSYGGNSCSWSIAIKPDNGILYNRGIQYKSLIPEKHKNNNRICSLYDDPFSSLTYKTFKYELFNKTVEEAKRMIEGIMCDFLDHIKFIDYLTESGCGILCEHNRREITLEEVFCAPNGNYGFILQTTKERKIINRVLNALIEKSSNSFGGGYKLISIEKGNNTEQHIFEITNMETFCGFCELFKNESLED